MGLHLSNAKVVEKLIKDKKSSVLAVETLRRTQMAKKKPKEYSQKEVIKYGYKHHLVGYKQLEDLVKNNKSTSLKKTKY